MSRRGVAAASLSVGAAAALALLVLAFLPADVHPLGWDAAGYVVQFRAAAEGILDLPGSRPGVGVAGAFLAGVGAFDPGIGPPGLSLVVAVALGLGCAVGVRRALPTAAWAVGLAVALVATWGGTTRLVSGYLASLLALGLFVLAMVIAVGGVARWPAVVVAFAASLLAHPGLAPVWAAILVGWVVLEVASRHDRDVARAAAALVAFLGTALVVAGLVAWAIGLSFDELQDLGVARERFDERAAEILAWIRPALSIALVGAGVTVALLLRPAPRSRAATRLGIAWLLVCAAGLPLLAVVPAVPGHRLVLLAVPVPLLGTWAIVVGASRLGRLGPAGAWVGPLVAIVLTAGVAIVALAPFHARASRTTPSIGPGPADVAGYLRAARVDVPVILVMDPTDRRGLLAWKARLNAVRALAPDDVMLRIVAYVGEERALASGRPTRGDALLDEITDRTWPAVRSALDGPHVVLVVRSWARPETWARVEDRAVSAEVAVVAGPRPAGTVGPVAARSIPPSEALARVAATILLLAAIGGGWARIVGAGDPVEAGALSPLAGLAVVVLVGVVAAIAGADPGGPAGLAFVSAAAIVGWIAPPARRARS